jgi:phosphatidylglycerophosphate synthase
MNAAIALLLIQGAMGALDTFIYHEFLQRLPVRAKARLELRLHALRDFAYAIVFGSLAWVEWRGVFAWLFVAILVFEIFITLWDFIEEDMTRPLPPGERVMHTLMAIIYGAFLANLAPQLWNWAQQPTGFAPVSYGFISWLMSLMAIGVFASGVRDWVASRQSLTA